MKKPFEALEALAEKRPGSLIETTSSGVEVIRTCGIGVGTDPEGRVMPVLQLNGHTFSLCCKQCAAQILVGWAETLQAIGNDIE